jgi:glycosyltransferase involved in cell wall biosynthesis
MKKKDILVIQNEFSSYGGYKTANDIEKYLKKNFNFHKIDNTKVKDKIYFKILEYSNSLLSKIFGTVITLPITPSLINPKKNYKKILIGYANKIFDLKRINNSTKKFFLIVNDEWIFSGFSHFYLENNIITNYFLKFIQKYTYRYFKQIIENSKNFYLICSCEYFKKIALQKYNLDKEKIITIKNPIDSKFWKKKSFSKIKKYKKKLSLNEKYFYILIFSRGGFNNFRKGGDRFKKLVLSLKDNKEIRFIMLGSKKIDKFKNCIFLNTRDNRLLREIIYACDVSVNFSRKEGIPYSILETMSCGTPVIATNCGGIKEIIKNGNNGYLFNNFNIKNIKKKILYLKNNPKELTIFSNKASKQIFLNHNQKKILNKYKKLLND